MSEAIAGLNQEGIETIEKIKATLGLLDEEKINKLADLWGEEEAEALRVDWNTETLGISSAEDIEANILTEKKKSTDRMLAFLRNPTLENADACLIMVAKGGKYQFFKDFFEKVLNN